MSSSNVLTSSGSIISSSVIMTSVAWTSPNPGAKVVYSHSGKAVNNSVHKLGNTTALVIEIVLATIRIPI